MKKGISLIFLALLLSSCGYISTNNDKKTLDEETSENLPTADDDSKIDSETDGGNEDNNSESNNEEDNKGEEDGESTDENKPVIDLPVLVNSLNLKTSKLELGLKKTYCLKYDILPSNATNKSVSWSSSNDLVCRVDGYGNLIARKVGTATITVSTKDGSNLSSICEVTVSEIAVTSLITSVSSLTLYEGENQEFSVSISPIDATNTSLEVTSLDSSVAEVNLIDERTYKVSANKSGNTQIKVQSLDKSGITKFIDVEVKRVNLESISINNEKVYLNVDSTFSLITTFVPSNASNKNISYISDNPSIATIDEKGTIVAISKGITLVHVTSEEGNYSRACEVNVEDKDVKIKSSLLYKQKDVLNNSATRADCSPSIGTVKTLVIPVWFTDSITYISSSNKSIVRNDIEKAFKGTNEEVGWRSVKTYYEELSSNMLTLDPIVTDWYECGLASSSFYSNESGGNSVKTLTGSAVSWFKTTNSLANLKDFDADSNGYIDSVILIYGAPDYESSNKNAENMWAYCSWNTNSSASYVNPVVNTFMWASYDFMYSSDKALEQTGKSKFGGGDTSHCEIDTHTYIHEMGHIFGLKDYYDYGPGHYSAAGAFSMQDENIGSHDPYSAMKLGWVNPYVVNSSETLTIKNFQDYKDVILVSNNFDGSPFNEYLLIELYTPTGLNEFDTINQYGGENSSRPKGAENPGIRIWHVDARLAYKGNSILSTYKENQLTSNPYTSLGKVSEAMCNSFGGERENIASFADYSELFMVRNNLNCTYTPNSTYDLKDEYLFHKNDMFNINSYSKQFKNSKKGVEESLLNNDEEFRFNITIKTLSSDEATIQIVKY